jgi:hypothetical protein
MWVEYEAVSRIKQAIVGLIKYIVTVVSSPRKRLSVKVFWCRTIFVHQDHRAVNVIASTSSSLTPIRRESRAAEKDIESMFRHLSKNPHIMHNEAKTAPSMTVKVMWTFIVVICILSLFDYYLLYAKVTGTWPFSF